MDNSSEGVTILFKYVFPIIGSILGFILSLTPVKAVHLAEKTGGLGNVNPLPACMFLCNCGVWLCYACAIRDPFIFCANVPSVPVSFHIILHAYVLAEKKVRDQMERTVLASSLLVLFVGLSYVFSDGMDTPIQLNGTVAMLVNILLYASPLSTVGHVIKTRNSSSIYLPWTLTALGCSFTWCVYGLATKRMPVIVPHSFGVILNILQLVLRALFRTIPHTAHGGSNEDDGEYDLSSEKMNGEGGSTSPPQAIVVSIAAVEEGNSRPSSGKRPSSLELTKIKGGGSNSQQGGSTPKRNKPPRSASRLSLVANDELGEGEEGTGASPQGAI